MPTFYRPLHPVRPTRYRPLPKQTVRSPWSAWSRNASNRAPGPHVCSRRRAAPLAAAQALESALSSSLGRPLVMNVSTALAVVMFEAGLPAALMRGVVLIARCAGLVGHLLEETERPVGDALWRGAEGAVDYQSD